MALAELEWAAVIAAAAAVMFDKSKA